MLLVVGGQSVDDATHRLFGDQAGRVGWSMDGRGRAVDEELLHGARSRPGVRV